MARTLEFNLYTDLVDQRLDEILPSADKEPKELHEAMRYSCLAPGKRIRPNLCMVCADAVGAEPKSVIDAACSVELIHCFSLIHDDLPAIDDDDLRRGRPTNHKKFGEALAVLAGDALFALAFEILAASPHSADRVVRSLKVLTVATGSDGLVGGEVVDVLSEGKPVTEGELDFIHTRKTGSLMAASCEIGAILGGGSDEQAQALSTYGMQVGLAFQIADDILNETSTPEALGKAAGSDRARQKATFPKLYGLEKSRKAAEAAVAKALEAVKSKLQTLETLEELARYAVDRLN